MNPTLTASAQGGFRFISLFSGIDAASVAWVPMGAECVAVAEVDKAACAVLAHRYPNLPNLGDVTAITEERIRALGHIDVVVFGSPCQDLSIAGKRSGLEGERSGLFFVAMRIVRWSGARWAVFENVPGLFSSNAGLDFAAVVREMVGVQPDVPACGWCNSGVFAGPDGLFEWATLDGQFFGVPQRRRRIFAVRDIGDWRSRPPILLEFDSLSGHPAPSREKGQGLTHDVAPSLTGSGRGVERAGDSRGQDPVVPVPNGVRLPESRHGASTVQQRVSCSQLDAETESELSDPRIVICMSTGQAGAEIGIGIGTTLNCNHEAPIVAQVSPPLTRNPYGDHESREDLLVTHALRGEGFDASEDGTGRGTPLVAVPHTDVLPTMQNGADTEAGHNARSGNTKDSYIVPMAFRAAGQDGFTPSGQCPPIASTDGGGAGVPTVVIPIQNQATRHAGTDGSGRQNGKGHGLGAGDPGDPMYTMTGGDQHAVFAMNLRGREGGAMPELDELASLRAASGGSSRSYVGGNMAVRRLTATECERLMGFPDGWTLVPYRGKMMADGPRYKMLGNSMITHCMSWIGKRIEMVRHL